MDIFEKKSKIALALIDGVGSYTFRKLLNKFGTANAVFKATLKDLASVINGKNNNHNIAKNIVEHSTMEQAHKIIEQIEKLNIETLFYGDEEYPTNLNHIHNPPSILYYAGQLKPLKEKKLISIVGTRRPSDYINHILENIIEALKPHNIAIISGLAYGIDISAHLIALKNDIPTYAILPGGINKIYPNVHTRIAENMINSGGLITEYPPNVKPEKHCFPLRNRIIAGISDIAIVAEAGEKSGALITAEFANQYNREVFAIPGNINSINAKGCNNLIKKHKAHMLTSTEDIEYIMNWQKAEQKLEANNNHIKLAKLAKGLSNAERTILDLLMNADSELHIDEISNQTQADTGIVYNLVITLETHNLIQICAGNKFKLKI
jgi:DNA processing protein